MTRAPRLAPAALFLIGLVSTATAQTSLSRRDIITGLSIPVEVQWGRDEWLWVLELGGRVLRVDPSTGESRQVHAIPGVYQRGESGALGMALHPDSSYVFLAYNYYEESESRLKLVRYRYDGNALVEPRVLVQRISATLGVTGGRVLITRDKKLLMTVGDLEPGSFAQSAWYLNGKTLRMNLDGSMPTDNPYPRAAMPLNLVWSTGHRDGRGLATTTSGVIFEAEQGRDSVDELNNITRRRNYGWPRVVGYCDAAGETKFCSDSNAAVPARVWRQQVFPGSLDYYDSPAIPEWRGSLLMPTLDEMDLRVLKVSGATITSESIHFDNEFGRLRDVCVAPDGRIFLATSNRDEKGIPNVKPGDDRIVEIGGNVALALLGTPSVSGDNAGVFRAGDSVRVSFFGQNFSGGNAFVAQLSDAGGSFAQPTVIGTLTAAGGGSIGGVIPCGIVAGSGYRFRIVTTSPAKAREVPGTYTIIAAPAARIEPRTPIQFCPGDSAVLYGTPGGENIWSSGERGDSLVVKNAGDYWVTLVTNGCLTKSQTVQVSFLSVPSPTITNVAANLLDAGSGYTRYEWYLDDTLLAETSRSVIAPRSGRYRVRVRNGSGCWGESQPYDYQVPTGISSDAVADRSVRIAPHPVTDRLAFEMAVSSAGELRMLLSDVKGNLLVEQRRLVSPGTFSGRLDVAHLPPGSYVLRLILGDRELTSRMIIKE